MKDPPTPLKVASPVVVSNLPDSPYCPPKGDRRGSLGLQRRVGSGQESQFTVLIITNVKQQIVASFWLFKSIIA